ncbi:MAG: hypothetical protein WD063_19895 [Pirellulales bacterium]
MKTDPVVSLSIAPAARAFRLDPQYVRSGIYIAIGFLLIGVAAVWMNRVGLGPPNAKPAAQFVVSCVIAAAGLLPLGWRLVVDERGVWRRRICRWELWSWDDFGSGRLKHGFHDRSLVDPERPWWRRTLSLGYLTEQDSEQVWKWIQLAWQPPKPDACPEELHLRYGNLWRGRPVWLDAKGIRIGKGSTQRAYDWNDVELLEVRRRRHERPDFHTLRLKLPRRTVHLRRTMQYGIESRNWKGAEPEQLVGFLLAHVPADRQVVLATAEAPRTPRELEVRLKESRKQLRDVYWLRIFIVSCMVGLPVWGWFGLGWWRALVFGVMLVLYFAVFQFFYRQTQDAHEKLPRAGEGMSRPAGNSEVESGAKRG